MSSVNKAIILGRLGRDPEVRNFQNGGRVVNFSVATEEKFKGRDGEPQKRTEWHNVAIFNEKLGEVAEKYLRKGSQVYIEGQIRTRKWQDQSGSERYTTEIVVPQYGGGLQLLGDARGDGAGEGGSGRASERGSERGSSRGSSSASSGTSSGGGWDSRKSDLDDEIPF